MVMPAASPHSTTCLRALIVSSVFAVLVADVGGRHHICPPFTCGSFSNISSPFRQQGDPPGCGFKSYELVCTDTNATIRIGSGTYYVVDISPTYFWVVDTNLGMQSSCPLPRWDYHDDELAPYGWVKWATFMNCSRAIKGLQPVICLSTNHYFIYVLTWYHDTVSARNFPPSCGYVATTPLGGPGIMAPDYASYQEVVEFMRKGFALRFPRTADIKECLAEWMREFLEEARNSASIKDWISVILAIDSPFWFCVTQQFASPDGVKSLVIAIIFRIIMPHATWYLKIIYVLCRFLLAPLAIFTFLAHKYWKTRIAIDAVEKFLQMQQMLGGPLRFAYTDLTAITSHFREKLGQGGYGSVYKGVLLPGEVQVAVKMLNNSKCNGEEFISEVSTIGRIHHINVVRLVGFCSEELRRALVYEYMPNGSLDKYIFSPEKSFSWDKLNEIALGIARGVNYLHQGCDMQIVHFDIKPYNILLDSNFIPKVADFGLAKLYPRDKSFVPLSAMRGTIGYIAPEMVSRSFGTISSKSDVYSFGILLLEMAGGRRNANPKTANSSLAQAYYPSLVYSQLTREGVGNITENVYMHELEKKLCIVGLRCIQMRPHDRPTMGEVIEMLEAGVDGLQIPPRPLFCDDEVADSYTMPSELNVVEEDEWNTSTF